MQKRDLPIEYYERIRSYMTVADFQAKFTELFNEWKKKNPGRSGSKVKFAEKLLVSDETINNWLRGKNKVSNAADFEGICTIFECDPEEFASELRYIPLNYPAEQAEKIQKEISARNIDLNLLNYITRNFDIPHSLSTDLFSEPSPDRPPAPNADAEDSLVVRQGRRTYYVDDQDLDLVAELQKRMEELIRQTFEERFKQYEMDYCNWIVKMSFGGLRDPQRDFEYRTQQIILYCPHLEPKDIVKMMEKQWQMKYKRKTYNDLLEEKEISPAYKYII